MSLTNRQYFITNASDVQQKKYSKDSTRGSPREYTRFIHDIGKEFRKPMFEETKRLHPRIRQLSAQLHVSLPPTCVIGLRRMGEETSDSSK